MKQPAATYLVFQYLQRRTEQGEFSTVAQIREETGASYKNIMSALWALQHTYTAVEAVNVGKVLHWFATPQQDKRSRIMMERALETKPRRTKPRKPNV